MEEIHTGYWLPLNLATAKRPSKCSAIALHSGASRGVDSVTGVGFVVEGRTMKLRSLAPSAPLVLLTASFLPAQQTLDSTNGRLAAILPLGVVTHDDWQYRFSGVESGNAEAQYG